MKNKSWHADPARRDLCNSNLFAVFLDLQTSGADVSQPPAAAVDSSSELFSRCRTSSLKPSGLWWSCTAFVGLDPVAFVSFTSGLPSDFLISGCYLLLTDHFPGANAAVGSVSTASRSRRPGLVLHLLKIIGEHNYSDSVRWNVFSLYSANSPQKAFQFTLSCAEQYRPRRPWHKGPLQTTIYISYLPKCLLQVTNGGLFKYLCRAANRICISNTRGLKRNIFSCLYPFVVKMHWACEVETEMRKGAYALRAADGGFCVPYSMFVWLTCAITFFFISDRIII